MAGFLPRQEFGALMSSYSLPPPLPTYHVLLEGEGLAQSLGNCRDDLVNVCMRHVEKMCKADLGRSFIERSHTENGRRPAGRPQGHGRPSAWSAPAALRLCYWDGGSGTVVPQGACDRSHAAGRPPRGTGHPDVPLYCAWTSGSGSVSLRSAPGHQAQPSSCGDTGT